MEEFLSRLLISVALPLRPPVIDGVRNLSATLRLINKLWHNLCFKLLDNFESACSY